MYESTITGLVGPQNTRTKILKQKSTNIAKIN